MKKAILGISAYYHDSAAALCVDGEIVAAAQEERFTRKKHDAGFPANAVRFVLEQGGIAPDKIDLIAFYDKPLLKFERLLETYHAFAPRGMASFLAAMPVWLKEKLFFKKMLREELTELGIIKKPLIFPEHHVSHAASAFYPSPFEEAAILTVDGVGEWATTTIGHGKSDKIEIIEELHFPHSLGLFYSAITYYCGFKVNSGEYKLMGLAPYGHNGEQTKLFKEKIKEHILDIREDGSLLLNMRYFNFATGLKMCNDKRWHELFGFEKRKPESELTQQYVDLALAAQQVTEEIVELMAKNAKAKTGCKNLVMAGGVALNCVANGKLIKKGIFENIWFQPAAGDAGGALGSALAAWHMYYEQPRKAHTSDTMVGSYLGPSFDEKDIKLVLNSYNAKAEHFSEFNDLSNKVAQLIADGHVIGWFQGRMEYGPRALGNRSILGDARNSEMQKKLNLKIKYRESFRPFAPAVLEDDITEYFDLSTESPYMLIVAPVAQKHCNAEPEGLAQKSLRERLYHIRSDIPAVTHIDYSARIQSVSKETNPRFWQLISSFKDQTGVGLVVNTSFNVRGEPIVCTPEDAYRCFMRTEMDYLVVGDYLFEKKAQPQWEEQDNWQETFVLD